MPKSTIKKVTVTDIMWDTDGEKVDGLPVQILIEIPASIKNRDDAEEYVSDKVSEVGGFCHDGFSCTPELSTLFKK
jgi:hypothetical protein